MVAEPGRLAFGVLSRHQCDAAAGLLQRDLAAEMGGRVPARRARAWRAAPDRGLGRAAHAPRPGRRRAACWRNVWRSRHAGPRGAGRAGWRRSATAQARAVLPARRRAGAGATPDLPGARDPLAVGRTQARRCGRVDFGQARVQAGGAHLRAARAPRSAPMAGIGDIRQPAGQRSEIQACAAGQDRQRPRIVRSGAFSASAASRHHATLPASAAAGRRRAGAAAASSAGRGRAVSTRRSR